jgi:hypothetical protein
MAIIENQVNPNLYHTDLLTASKKIGLLFTVPMFKGISYIALSLISIIAPFSLIFFAPLLLIIFFASPKFEFPARAPVESKRIDKSDPLDSGKGFNKARGEVYLGWHRGTGKEAWASWNDMLTHLYMLAATGGGKSEAIWAILSNFYLSGSAYTLGDGKGTLEMIQNGRVLARIFGVEDDYFVINFISPNAKKKYKAMSNNMNTWSQGTAAQLKSQMASLALSGDAGQNQFFEDNAEVIIERVFPAFVELRDKGALQLDIQVIGSYLTLPRMYELSNHPQLSPLSKRYIVDYLSSLGFNFETPNKQSDEVNKQYGQFVTHFSKIISSLSIQYRDIYVVDQGDINQKDITSNRRTLLFALPSLEKSGTELKNLGNILLTGQKNAVSTDLGDELEGTREKTTARLAKNNTVPYGLAFDEWAFYAIKDMALLPAQIRGIKYSALYAAQDYKGTERAGEMDAEQVFSNTRFKFFGALEEAGASWTRIRDLIGEFLVAINSNYKYLPGLFGGRQIIDRERTEITKRAPIEIGDLQKQISGEFFMFMRGKLSPIRFFHSNLEGLDKDAANGNGFKLNRLCRVYAPSDEEIQEIDRNESFLSVMYSSGKLFSNIDVVSSLKKQISSLRAQRELNTIDYANVLTSFVEDNSVTFGLRLTAPKYLKPLEHVSAKLPTELEQVSIEPEIAYNNETVIHSEVAAQPETNTSSNENIELNSLDSLDAFADLSPVAPQVAANVGLPENKSAGNPANAPQSASQAPYVNPDDGKEESAVQKYLSASSSNIAVETVKSKLDIMENSQDIQGAHILSESESKRIVEDLRDINLLLGFSDIDSMASAQKTVNNLHKYCYYLAPPKPSMIQPDLVAELDARINQILS